MDKANAWGIDLVTIANMPHFDKWVTDFFQGDHQTAAWVVNCAVDYIQQLIESDSPPVMGMFIGMMLVSLSGAGTDMDTRKLTEFVKDQGVPMYDIARRLVQVRANEMAEIKKRAVHLELVR